MPPVEPDIRRGAPPLKRSHFLGDALVIAFVIGLVMALFALWGFLP